MDKKIRHSDDTDTQNVIDVLKVHNISSSQQILDELAQLIKDARIEAVGWTWAEACADTKKGLDVRTRDPSTLLPRIEEDLAANNKACEEAEKAAGDN